MKKHKIVIRETLERIVEIEAINEFEAINIAEDMHKNCEIELTADDFIYHSIENYKDDRYIEFEYIAMVRLVQEVDFLKFAHNELVATSLPGESGIDCMKKLFGMYVLNDFGYREKYLELTK
ncbi:MAG: DpnD/PcfM family protein [Clostridium sp.]